MRTAESVVLTDWPPGPEARLTSMRRSLASSISTSTSSASGSTATVAVEVWMRPCDSVAGTRCTRCTPPSYLSRLQAPWPLISKMTSRNPLAPDSLAESVSDLPAVALGVAGVHAEEVGREEGRLLAAGAGADLDDDVAVVVGILGQELDAQILHQPGLLGLVLGDELAGHLLEL